MLHTLVNGTLVPDLTVFK